jgi:predicted N-acetyltransferase YhbS
MSVIIERMGEADIEPVARLRLSTFLGQSERTLEQDMAGLRGLEAPGDSLEVSLVARVGGKLAGSALLVRNELDAAHGLTPWLAGLVVVPEHRRLGIGSALVRAIETRAASAGVSELHLYTWDARDFYARLGWSAVEKFDQGGETMLLMGRSLVSEPAGNEA